MPVTGHNGTDLDINCVKDRQPTKTGGNGTSCSIYPSNTESNCNGGLQTFNINSIDSNPVYEIDVSCAGAVNHFKVTQCNEVIREYTETGSIRWTVEDNPDINVIQTNPTIKFSAKPSVRTVTITATETTYGVSKSITITLPSN